MNIKYDQSKYNTVSYLHYFSSCHNETQNVKQLQLTQLERILYKWLILRRGNICDFCKKKIKNEISCPFAGIRTQAARVIGRDDIHYTTETDIITDDNVVVDLNLKKCKCHHLQTIHIFAKIQVL